MLPAPHADVLLANPELGVGGTPGASGLRIGSGDWACGRSVGVLGAVAVEAGR